MSSVGSGALAVADGVSGWAEDGVDPAEYSRWDHIGPQHTTAPGGCSPTAFLMSGLDLALIDSCAPASFRCCIFRQL